MASDKYVRHHPSLELNKLYFIDFGGSRQLEFGPGRQHAIDLPGTQTEPPLEMKRFDPYSWDIYCVGKTIEELNKVRTRRVKRY